MTQEMSATATETAYVAPAQPSKWRAHARTVGRYSLSAFGPMSIAAAHFIAAIVFLRVLAPAEFGLVSFLFVATPPFLSVTMSLLAASLLTTLYREKSVAEAEIALHLKANLSISLGVAVLLGGMMLAVGAGALPAVLFGAYGGLMSLRQFARCYTYIQGRLFAVAASDVTYSTLLLAGLAALFIVQGFTVTMIAAVMAGAALLAVLPFGGVYLRRQFTAGFFGWGTAYRAIWRDLARWSLLGVVSTEMTANAHAYLVTLLAGPRSFAVIAAGALFLRPVSLFLTSLPEMERPVMARHIVAGDIKGAFRPVRTFRYATGAVWLVTVAATAAMLIWFPDTVLRGRYDVTSVAMVAALWAAVMAVRVIRTPDGVLMQAAAEWRALAWASVGSAGVSLVCTLVLLLVWGPIVSLIGILAGDLVMMVRIKNLIAKWKARHHG